MIRIIYLFVLTSLALSGCKRSDLVLQDKDFTTGNWLLVNDTDSAILIIDDEQILSKSKNGLWVTPLGDCKWTTCDGLLRLFKDGKLIAEKGYLSRSALYESGEIKKAYKKGSEFYIEPKDRNDFNRIWDSLKTEKAYPTIYHTQPADKDIIRVYKVR